MVYVGQQPLMSSLCTLKSTTYDFLSVLLNLRLVTLLEKVFTLIHIHVTHV